MASIMKELSELDHAQHELQARKALDEDVHYMTSLTQMADVKEVVAREEVFTAKGIKLLDRGVAIGSDLRERLLKHVLLKPIDQSLVIKDGVTADLLAEEAAGLIASEPFLQNLQSGGEEIQRSQDALRQLRLPEQLGFKLTVMRTQLPWLFKHILMVVLVGHYLVQRLRLSPQQGTDAMLSGLVHDIGELHTDPSLLDRRHRVSETEFAHIDAHPITGYLIAREILPANPEVAAAVLQHHERLDGSGYPYGLRGERVSLLARVIAVADACASIIARYKSSERLRALLQLNRRKFDPVLIALLQRALVLSDGGTATTRVDFEQIQAAAQMLLRWTEISAARQGVAPAELGFLFERMSDVRIMLVQFGLDQNDPRAMQALVGDQVIARELSAVFDEVRWQIADLQRETQRRREAIAATMSTADSTLLDTWLAAIRDFLQAVTGAEQAPSTERRRISEAG